MLQNDYENNLKHQIQQKREELIQSGLRKGLEHRDTIMISEEMDKLIYEMQKKLLKVKSSSKK
ncbi:aspartyl-phosphate phosphatase Spo0E family protein [Gracilibacillus dipsosauri]|uniref:Aspartyl-phosphate phosphatase Spo0E family protein n=1 Tax=Gracilibacillus dipsosauri TaxID=178340 RepID=A0A317KW41_9BACI|nr:aspartyl-phosphate phosphatase Spo0E family protein [Gracilibacillus dipsosauri]PWU67586.1 aspartyl-phosphate phosphatase Spo0E family protein [Gracilibacillus dipsosauri]